MQAPDKISYSAALGMYDRVAGQTNVDWNALRFEMLRKLGTLLTPRVKARTFMFVQVYHRHFKGGNEGGLEAEIDRANKDPSIDHMNPLQLSQWLSFPAEPTASGVARLDWLCNYRLRGYFTWEGGRSKAFDQWLKVNAEISLDPTKYTDLDPGAVICCWEAAFYALIKAGCMMIDEVRDVYAKSKVGTTEAAVYAYLEKKMAFRHDGSIVLPINMNGPNFAATKLTAGDILLLPISEVKDVRSPDPGNVLHHVVLVQQDTPAEAKSPVETMVFQLWGGGSSTAGGAGFAETVGLDEVLALVQLQKTPIFYRVPFVHDTRKL